MAAALSEPAPQVSFLIMLVIYLWIPGQRKWGQFIFRDCPTHAFTSAGPCLKLGKLSWHKETDSTAKKNLSLRRPRVNYETETKCTFLTQNQMHECNRFFPKCLNSPNQLFVWILFQKLDSWRKHSTPKYQGCKLKQVLSELGRTHLNVTRVKKLKCQVRNAQVRNWCFLGCSVGCFKIYWSL